MASIKPAEVSAILKQQLTNFDANASLAEVEVFYKLEMVLHVFMDYLTYNTVNWLSLKTD